MEIALVFRVVELTTHESLSTWMEAVNRAFSPSYTSVVVVKDITLGCKTLP